MDLLGIGFCCTILVVAMLRSFCWHVLTICFYTLEAATEDAWLYLDIM